MTCVSNFQIRIVNRFFFFQFHGLCKLATHLGGGDIVGNWCDFFIGIIGTFHYFELGLRHPRNKLGCKMDYM